MRLLVYSPSTHGLGHITMFLPYLAELHRRRPETRTRVVTPLVSARAFTLPAGMDLVRLPSDLNVSAPHRERIRARRRQLLLATAQAFAPDLLLVDMHPAGKEDELLPAIAWLRGQQPWTRWVLFSRDIISAPERARATLQRQPGAQLLTDLYDRILVHGDPAVSRFVEDGDLPEPVAGKVAYTGYVLPETELVPRDTLRQRLGAGDRPLVVVTTGSGVDGAAVVRAYASARQEGLLDGVVSFVVTGPSLPDRHRAPLGQALAQLPDTTVVPFTADLGSYIRAADVTVCMGGMTSWEAPARGCRAVVVPRGGGDAEQRARAARLAELGLISVVPWDELTPETLAGAVRRALAEPPPRWLLDAGGLHRTADMLEQLLDGWTPA